MQLYPSSGSASARGSLVESSRRSWQAELHEPLLCCLADGSRLTLLTGLYTLRELNPIEYELTIRLGEAVCLRLREIEHLRAMSQLTIEGAWP